MSDGFDRPRGANARRGATDARASRDDDARASARTTSNATNSFGSVREKKSERRARDGGRDGSSVRARAQHGDRERAKTTKPTSERMERRRARDDRRGVRDRRGDGKDERDEREATETFTPINACGRWRMSS